MCPQNSRVAVLCPGVYGQELRLGGRYGVYPSVEQMSWAWVETWPSYTTCAHLQGQVSIRAPRVSGMCESLLSVALHAEGGTRIWLVCVSKSTLGTGSCAPETWGRIWQGYGSLAALMAGAGSPWWL